MHLTRNDFAHTCYYVETTEHNSPTFVVNLVYQERQFGGEFSRMRTTPHIAYIVYTLYTRDLVILFPDFISTQLVLTGTVCTFVITFFRTSCPRTIPLC